MLVIVSQRAGEKSSRTGFSEVWERLTKAMVSKMIGIRSLKNFNTNNFAPISFYLARDC